MKVWLRTDDDDRDSITLSWNQFDFDSEDYENPDYQEMGISLTKEDAKKLHTQLGEILGLG